MNPNQPTPQPINNPAPGAFQPNYANQFQAPPPAKKSRWPFVVIGVVVLLLVVISVVIVVMNRAQQLAPKTQKNTTATTATQAPGPASAIDVQQTDSSISQDLSGIDDDSDLPAGSLDDKTLGL